ncbi:MAG: ASKHA domain-containing protein [Candidatus Omnitrophota bacterium]
MKKLVRIEIQPLGKTVDVEAGAPLRDVLFDYGVEFPCGGRGVCRGCRIKVLNGNIPITPEQESVLTAEELAQGWRLACLCAAENDLALEIAQWEAPILADHSAFEFVPGEGLGVAVDLGTTTIAAQLLNLQTGEVLAVKSSLNPQARHGADVMSRIHFALDLDGQKILNQLIRREIGSMILDLLDSIPPENTIGSIAIAGNTAMHNLFCGINVKPLGQYPFEPLDDGLQEAPASALGWSLPGDPLVRFLPGLGGFVGSDILAGIMAVKMYESSRLAGLIDLGTNGEIVLGNRDRMVCASTAAGPAFEGARISMGMRAAAGAVSQVRVVNGELIGRVLGEIEPRGICGSGLVDAIAAGLELKKIHPSGRLNGGEEVFIVCPPVTLKQRDIRELQLAKGAIAAGVRILLDRLGAKIEEIDRVYLAGAFGNYINIQSAIRIGLLNFPPQKIVPSGNTALLGAKLSLFQFDRQKMLMEHIIKKTEHISLNEDPQFQQIYVEEMTFPDS